MSVPFINSASTTCGSWIIPASHFGQRLKICEFGRQNEGTLGIYEAHSKQECRAIRAYLRHRVQRRRLLSPSDEKRQAHPRAHRASLQDTGGTGAVLRNGTAPDSENINSPSGLLWGLIGYGCLRRAVSRPSRPAARGFSLKSLGVGSHTAHSRSRAGNAW